jgi:hypothetical protein
VGGSGDAQRGLRQNREALEDRGAFGQLRQGGRSADSQALVGTVDPGQTGDPGQIDQVAGVCQTTAQCRNQVRAACQKTRGRMGAAQCDRVTHAARSMKPEFGQHSISAPLRTGNWPSP